MKPLIQDEEKRLARLQKYIEKVEEAQAEMIRAINSGEMEAFSEEDVRFHLSHDSDMIAEAGLFLAKLRRAYEYAKNDTKTIRAEIRHKCNQHKTELGLSSASDRDDYVQLQPEYKKAVEQEIEWKDRVEQMENIYNRYESLFVGSRKIASLLEKDNQNNYRREKYD